MKALVHHGPGRISWDEVSDPVVLDDTDAIVRVDITTICGTDLHIIKGDLLAVARGRILGHEAVGTVVEIGGGVRRVKLGDRVLVSCVMACGTCRYCRDGHSGQCLGGGGWILGNTIDGTQAELVRVPFVDLSTYPVPPDVTDEVVLMVADILPTSYEVGVLNGKVHPGDVVAIIGAGPIGLSAVITAKLYSPAKVIVIDKDDGRLELAKMFGADVTINNLREDPHAVVMEMTGELGVDVAMEAAGVPATFELAVSLIRPGGRVANIGVHGKPVILHLEDLWSKNVTISTGLVDAYSTSMLLGMVAMGQLEDAAKLVTHRFCFDEFEHAYAVFGDAARTGALKVVLTNARA